MFGQFYRSLYLIVAKSRYTDLKIFSWIVKLLLALYLVWVEILSILESSSCSMFARAKFVNLSTNPEPIWLSYHVETTYILVI